MKVEDIIHKPSPARISVTAYIKEKKGKDIVMNLEKNLPRSHPLFSALYQNQLSNLNKAFSTASEYFINK